MSGQHTNHSYLVEILSVWLKVTVCAIRIRISMVTPACVPHVLKADTALELAERDFPGQESRSRLRIAGCHVVQSAGQLSNASQT